MDATIAAAAGTGGVERVTSMQRRGHSLEKVAMSRARRAALEALLCQDRQFPLDAYVFVSESLQYAQQVLGMGRSSPYGTATAEAHVTGQELCEAVRQYALEQFGLLAKLVLAHWNIRSTSDIGDIVYNLIAIGEMKKSDTDRREDFDDVYDFDEAFDRGYEMPLPKS